MPYVIASDDFNRANASTLGSNWLKQPTDNDFTIVSGQAAPNLTGDNTMLYQNASWPNDQYSQVRITNFGTGGLIGEGVGVAVRITYGPTDTFYRLVAVATLAGADVELGKKVNGTYTSLQTVAGHLVANDVLKLAVFGSTLRMYKNGVQIGTDVIDTALTTGAAGITYSSALAGNPTIDDWEGGHSVIDTPRPGYKRFTRRRQGI